MNLHQDKKNCTYDIHQEKQNSQLLKYYTFCYTRKPVLFARVQLQQTNLEAMQVCLSTNMGFETIRQTTSPSLDLVVSGFQMTPSC